MIDRGAIIEEAYKFGMFQHLQEVDAFIAYLNLKLPLGNIGPVIEIGAHKGGTSVLFLELGANPLISVDLPDGKWGGVGTQAALDRNTLLSAKYGHRFRGILGDSHLPSTLAKVERALNGAKANVLFIDGDHSYSGVESDYMFYSTHVKTDGVIAFHDISETALHAERGVEVPAFWKTLKGEKHEFKAGEPWGGIGVTLA